MNANRHEAVVALPPGLRQRFGQMFFAAIALLVCGPLSSHAELVFAPSWDVPTYDAVREQVLQWIDAGDYIGVEHREGNQDESMRVRLKADWPRVELRSTDGDSLLRRLVETFAQADARAERLVAHCNSPRAEPALADSTWLGGTGLGGTGLGGTGLGGTGVGDAKLSLWMRRNLQLYYARWLAQQGFYDELLAELEEIAPAEVVDPAALLFCRMVAHHQLVHPDKSRAALAQLLEHEEALPRRYLQLAQLVKRDLATLEDDSLDHIARRMNDVQRRLDFGRAGDQVQMIERSVVQSLDKLIKKIEEQQQQSRSSGSGQGSCPMQDSRPGELKAPGRVDPRDIGSQSGWGDLPPKQREQALQQIGREFPAHYREMIEQYFRDLANEGNQETGP